MEQGAWLKQHVFRGEDVVRQAMCMRTAWEWMVQMSEVGRGLVEFAARKYAEREMIMGQGGRV